jgi:hypothetical protein
MAPWGTQQSQGYIDTTSVRALGYKAAGLTTISGLDQSAVARLVASGGDPKHPDAPGAFITSPGFLPAGATVVNVGAFPQVTAQITGITNPTGETITISTAQTQNLAPGVSLAEGDVVTISGVTGQTAINGRWLVTNVKLNSFDLRAMQGITGDNTPSRGGTWTLTPSFVTFKTSSVGNWTPPKDNALHPFTFSITSGTTVPTNITGPTGAQPGDVITINGKGLIGVFGVSFNGYPGTIVGGSIASITNTSNPIVITLPLWASTNGLTTGDTVTISNVIDQTTGKPATINRQWTVGTVTASTPTTKGSFQLIGNILPGDNDPMSGGSWIDGTDVAVKVIVPNIKSNATLPNGNTPTNPGPTGKIGVRNASGTTYSTADFTVRGLTIGAPDPTVAFVKALYQDVLDRSPDAQGMASWVAFLQAGGSREQVAEGFWGSPEHRGMQVDQFYATYLHRTADPAGRAYWVNQLMMGATEAEVATGFLTSEEYSLAHRSTVSYLFGLYADVLGRTPDADGLDAWLGAAQGGLGRTALADGFLLSPEADLRQVAGDYANYLGRSGEAAGVAAWLGALENGESAAQVAEAFLASDEFFTRAGG